MEHAGSRAVVFAFLLLLAGTGPAIAPASADEPPAPAPPPATVPADPVLAALLDPPATGLLVLSVQPGSTADRAGVGAGTILLAYAGTALDSAETLRTAIQGVGEAKDASLTWRTAGGETKTARVAPGRLGVSIRAVVKGQGLPPLPPETVTRLDARTLAQTPGESW